MSDKQKKKLDVELFWPPVSEKKKFEDKAESVSSENKVGEFDILPQHANFITLIFNSLTIKTTEREEKTYEFSRGVLETTQGKVRIFLEV